MDNCGSKWCGDSSQHGVGTALSLYDKHRSSSKTLMTLEISNQASRTIGNLDNTLRGRRGTIPGSSQSVNDCFEIKASETPSESKGDFAWSIVDRDLNNQSKVIEDTTEFRLGEPAHLATRRGWKFAEELGSLGPRQLFRDERWLSLSLWMQDSQ